MGRYDNTCWSCKNLCSSNDYQTVKEYTNGTYRTIRCREYSSRYVDPYADKCSNYRDAHYSERYIEQCIEQFDRWCNYYIISACTRIVDVPNAESLLNAFKDFKDEEIKKDVVVSALQKFAITPEELMADYDNYGKAVADAMQAAHDDPETKTACEEHIKTCILPRLDALLALKEEGKIRQALLGYIGLTRDLMEFYHISYTKPAESMEDTEAPKQR